MLHQVYFGPKLPFRAVMMITSSCLGIRAIASAYVPPGMSARPSGHRCCSRRTSGCCRARTTQRRVLDHHANEYKSRSRRDDGGGGGGDDGDDDDSNAAGQRGNSGDGGGSTAAPYPARPGDMVEELGILPCL